MIWTNRVGEGKFATQRHCESVSKDVLGREYIKSAVQIREQI